MMHLRVYFDAIKQKEWRRNRTGEALPDPVLYTDYAVKPPVQIRCTNNFLGIYEIVGNDISLELGGVKKVEVF